MRLAVVIPCYNHARYIGPAIESVLGQTRPPERLLIIDDGSRDDSVDVIRQYEGQGVELIVQENAGAHNTINRAIQIAGADCDLISILNSDDIYEPRRFEALLPAFSASQPRSVACSGLRMIDSDGAPLGKDEPRARWLRAAWSLGSGTGTPQSRLETWEWLGAANFLVTSSNIVARADYLKENPFRPYRYNHDYFFFTGAALRDEIHVEDECLLQYRVHPHNNINAAPAPLLKEMLRMHLDFYHDHAGEIGKSLFFRRRFYAYMSAAWSSISSFHAGLFQFLLAKLAEGRSEEELEHLVASLDEERFTELHEYPNAALVNHWNERTPLLCAHELAARFQETREAKRTAEKDRRTLKESLRLRQKLASSRWLALGQLLGQTKKLDRLAGKTPEDQLASLHEAIRQSAWCRIGRALGSKTSKELGEI